MQAIMQKYPDRFSKTAVLAVGGLSRQGLVKALRAKTEKEGLDLQVATVVNTARQEAPRIGARSMFHTYKVEFTGVNCFEQTVARLGLGVPVRKKRKIQTTCGIHEPEDVNLTNGLVLNRPRQVIAADITYFTAKGRLYYIFTLKDAYSGLILGLTGSNNMRAENAIKTLKAAFRLGSAASFEDCIHHSDAGGQYKSNGYKKLLHDNNIKVSIADNCLENGMAEQLNGLIKNDYLMFKSISNVGQLNRELRKLQCFLNNKRTIECLGYLTPAAFEQLNSALPPDKRMKKKLYDFTTKTNKPP
jgi:transposase InsO family protein